MLSLTRVLALGIAILHGSGAGSLAAPPLYLYAAASLETPLEIIATDFTKKNGKKVVLAFGGSGDLARQIAQGAPAAIFISANPQWMDHLQQRGLLREESRLNLLGNRLALVTATCAARPEANASVAGVLGQFANSRIAMGDPASVPVGTYAREALTALSLWESAAPRAIYTQNVQAALNWVARCETELAIVYESDALQMKDRGVIPAALFPAKSHAPILYPMAIIKGGNEVSAQGLWEYLSSEEAMAVFLKHGFTRASPPQFP